MSIEQDSRSNPLAKRNIGIAALVLAAAMVIVFGKVMIAGDSTVLSYVGCDVYSQELGRHIFNYTELGRGNFALWCPNLFCGYPSFGGMQTGLLYPLSLPFLFLSVVKGINWSFILHTYLGGMLMYFWLARQSLHRFACLAGALMFAFCAPFYLRIFAGHLTPSNTITWIPLVLLAIDGMIAAPSLGWLLLGTGAVSMELLAGYPQILFYTAIAAGLYTLLRIHESPRILKSLGYLALMNVFVLGLTCVQWATGIAAANETVRSAGVPYEFAATVSMPPENWLTLITPRLFGDFLTVTYWGRWYVWETCVFFGSIGVLLSIVGLFHVRRRKVLSIAGLVVVTAILATGAYSPHFRFFYDHVPGFNMFRSNSKFSILTVIFLIFLSAHGFDMLMRDERSGVLCWIFCGALAACVVVATMYVAARFCSISQFKPLVANSLNSSDVFWPNAQQTLNSPTVITRFARFAAGQLATTLYVLAAFSVLIGIIWWRRRWRSRVAPIVVGLIGLELLQFACNMTPSFSPKLVREPFSLSTLAQLLPDQQVDRKPISDLTAFFKQNLGDARILSLSDSNIAMLMDGVSELWGYGPNSPVRRYAEFIAFSQGKNPDYLTGYEQFKGANRRFDMLRCKYIVFPQAQDKLDVLPFGKSVLPRFALVNDWIVEPRRDAVFKAIQRADFDPRATVVLEHSPRDLPAGSSSPFHDSKGAIRLLRESTDWQEIEVTADKPAILLETDLYTPNWHVRALPGSAQQDYELIPANYVLRGIPLKAGTHRLRIEYLPIEFVIGKWVSLVSLAVYMALAIVWLVRRSKNSATT